MRAVRFAHGIFLVAAIWLTYILVHGLCNRSIQLPSIHAFKLCIPIACLLSLGVAYRKLPSPAKVKLSMLMVSSAFVLFFVEFLLNVGPEGIDDFKRRLIAMRDGVEFDGRSLHEVVRQLRLQGMDAYPAVAPTNFVSADRDTFYTDGGTSRGAVLMPLGSISSRPTLVGNEGGKYIIYTTDEHGFNNPKGIWNSRSIDVAMVGDSFTFGNIVDPNGNIAGHIRKLYSKNTLNLGWSGNGPLLMLASMKEYLRPLKPTIVLWFYFEGNDLAELESEKRNGVLMEYLGSEFQQDLVHRQAEVDAFLANYVQKWLESEPKRRTDIKARLRLNNIRTLLGLSGMKSGLDADFDLFRNVLLDAKEFVASFRGRLYFVYLPEWSRYRNPKRASPHRDRVLLEVSELGIPIVDIHEVFDTHPDPVSLYIFRLDGHYTEEGYRLVADAVMSRIERDQEDRGEMRFLLSDECMEWIGEGNE